MRRLPREPLVHFLAAGLLLFAFYEFNAGEEAAPASPKVIQVDREALLNFMQYRAQAFEPALFRERLKQMPPAQLDALVQDYVREEALYREALAMNLDDGDYIIRQRLVQKLDFLLEGGAAAAAEPDPQAVGDFYERYREDYRVDPVYTFTHIFFDAEKHGLEQARQQAVELLDSPAIEGVDFSAAGQFGDRYHFLRNYVERTRDYVVNNFSENFVAGLDAIAPAQARWHGPIESRYGYHLVLLKARTEAFTPPLEDIRGRVVEDYRYESALLARQQAEDRLISAYDVNLNLE